MADLGAPARKLQLNLTGGAYDNQLSDEPWRDTRRE
jgi:hypothetical protein